MDLHEGDVVGSYRLEKKLGRGSFGEVWTGRHREWPDKVEAFKFPSCETALDRLRTEAAALRRLEHPNIVRVLDIDTLGEKPHLRLEFVEGRSLERALKEGALEYPEALRIFRAVLEALAFAHEKGVLHRDVKPANILLSEEGTVKLSDFGLAERSVQKEALAASLGSAEAPPAAAGTLEYMAPELLEGGTPTRSSDVYSLGKVLYFMLTGRKHSGLKRPGELNPSVPEEMDRIVAKMLEASGERYAGAEAVLEDLDRISAGPEGASGAAAPAKPRGAVVAEGFPLGEAVFAAPVVLLAAMLTNYRFFSSPLMIAAGFLCLVAALVTARFSTAPILSSFFWAGLVFGFLGARLHPAVLWGGLAVATTAAILRIALGFARR